MCFRGSFHQHTDTSPKPFSPATDAPTVPFLPFLTATAGQKRSIAGALLHTLSLLPNGDNSAQSRCTPPRTVTARSSIARNPSPFSSPCSSSVPPFPGLHPRDIRSVDPSLFSTNLVPSLLVYEHMILLNLGSLQAIAMKDCVLIFEYNRKGGQAFLESLLPRLNPKNCNGGPSMPFELEIWLQLAYSWMRFSEEIKAILGTTKMQRFLKVAIKRVPFDTQKRCLRPKSPYLKAHLKNGSSYLPIEKE
ncbi:Magnesium transporter MRS2-11 [Arachis hypogaea]|nr:Magnesium transporter MRS2-11 [Arachis hypogaea]